MEDLDACVADMYEAEEAPERVADAQIEALRTLRRLAQAAAADARALGAASELSDALMKSLDAWMRTPSGKGQCDLHLYEAALIPLARTRGLYR